MKVVLEARALGNRGSGVRTYVVNLIKALRHKPGIDLKVLTAQTVSDRKRPADNVIAIKMGHELLLPWWLNVALRSPLKKIAPEVVHFTKADVPAIKQYPTVVTIYDVIPLLLASSQRISRQWYWPRALQRAVKFSDHILTISEASRVDIIKYLGVRPEKVTATPLAVDLGRFHPAQNEVAINKLKKRLIMDQPYLLFVGRLDQRKNLPALLAALEQIKKEIPHILVIVGKTDPSFELPTTLKKYPAIEERIRVLDYVTPEDLPVLYQGADLLVWPSVYEGWGFPPQEAMACGVPVIVSNGGSLPEVVGEAGEIVSYEATGLLERLKEEEFAERLAARIMAVTGDQERRQRMVTAGLERVQQYSWARVAEKTMEVYGMVISNQ